MTLRLLADIDHRQAEAIGEKGCKWDARSLATRHAIELLETGFAQNDAGGEIHHGRAHARKGEQLAAIDIDRARHAGGEFVGLRCIEVHRLDLPEHPRYEFRHHGAVGECRLDHRSLLWSNLWAN